MLTEIDLGFKVDIQQTENYLGLNVDIFRLTQIHYNLKVEIAAPAEQGTRDGQVRLD